MIYGVLPMAGKGSRIQPIAFSKELFPVAFKAKHYAISEFSIRSMIKAGVDEIKLVISPDKLDIPKYYSEFPFPLCMYFYRSPSLPESCLYPITFLRDDDICLFGLPDTLFAPNDGYIQIKNSIESGADLALGLFSVENPYNYDSVSMDDDDNITGVLVKKRPALSNWVWGIWGGRVKTLKRLQKLIQKQQIFGDERLLGVGFEDLTKLDEVVVKGVRIGSEYFDIGTMESIVKVPEVASRFEI